MKTDGSRETDVIVMTAVVVVVLDVLVAVDKVVGFVGVRVVGVVAVAVSELLDGFDAPGFAPPVTGAVGISLGS